MNEIRIDTGVQEFCINGGPEAGGGVLRFNPGDPNVYQRFFDAQGRLLAIEQELVEQGRSLREDQPESLRLMAEADRRVKELLGWVFGPVNDFDAMLGGVNVMAVGGNGERVVTNLFAALCPIIEEGARRCAHSKAAQAVAEAEARRAAQSR